MSLLLSFFKFEKKKKFRVICDIKTFNVLLTVPTLTSMILYAMPVVVERVVTLLLNISVMSVIFGEGQAQSSCSAVIL